MVKGRRKKLFIHEIHNMQGTLVNTQDQIRRAAVEFFQDQFAEEPIRDWPEMMECIPTIITNVDNDQMSLAVTLEEVRKVVNDLNNDNTSGPNGFIGLFFQHCWEIIGKDVTRMVRAFFCGHMLPRFVTHTNLVLLPKKIV